MKNEYITERENKEKEYDIALSFAGEDRNYVDKVAKLLKAEGINVFYDLFEEEKLWGKNLYEYLIDIYQNKAKFTIMFISKYYADKLWTNHERKAMQARAFQESYEYILPARFDNTKINGILDTIGYINLKKKTHEEFVMLIKRKLGFSNITKDDNFDKGVKYYEIKKYDKAIENFTKAIENNKNNIDAYFYRGKIFLIKYKYSKNNNFLENALNDFNNMLKIEPNNIAAHKYKIDIYANGYNFSNGIKGVKAKKITCEEYVTIDEKGRIKLPAMLFNNENIYNLIITTGLKKYLILIKLDEFDKNIYNYYNESILIDENINISENTLCHAQNIEIDKVRRIVIPSYLRQYAGLERNAIIVGLGEYYTIWDEETYKRYKIENSLLVL